MIRQFLVATALVLSASHGVAEEQAPPSVAAEFPAGTFLENLTVLQDGSVAFTSYFEQRVYLLAPDNQVSTLAELPVHPVGILPYADGFIVTAHGAAFTEGPAFTQTQQILLLNSAGEVTATIPAPAALFLNGMTRLDNGAILIADSIAGTIWQFDLETRSFTSWMQHELLAQNKELQTFLPGANGIKLDGDRILVSNSGRGALYQIAVEAGAPGSEPQLVSQTGPIDDFWIDEGRIVFTTHAASLKAIGSDGAITALLTEGCDGCTSVVRRGDDYLVLTTGGMLEGHADPARVLEIPAN
jgi:hypothetical protein